MGGIFQLDIICSSPHKIEIDGCNHHITIITVVEKHIKTNYLKLLLLFSLAPWQNLLI